MPKFLLTAVSTIALVGCVSTPNPLTPADKQEFSIYLQENLTLDQEQVTQEINLHEAMARAIKYNLDHRVSMLETSLAQRDFKLSRYDLLPQLVANSGYAGRNNEPGASSLSLLTGQQSLEPSTSTQRNVFTADLSASWNILDFGLSYIRARQLGDEVLINEERRRRTINTIIQDVQTEYWRAASAQRLTDQLKLITVDTQRAYDESRQLYANRKASPLSALSYQRELNNILAEAQTLRRELTLSKKRLAELMNLPAGTKFDIKLPNRIQVPGNFNLNLSDAIGEALENRPEVREAAYRVRMGDRDLQTALLEALPGVEIYGAINYDSNDFLFNNDYTSWGARASWNVIRVFETPARRRRAKAHIALEKQRALATAMAVSSQVHVSMVQYNALKNELETAARGHKVQEEILTQITTAYQQRAISYQTLVRERMNMIVTEARYDIAYAALQDAYTNMYTTIGYDPFGADISGTEDIKTIAQSLKALWADRKSNQS